MTTIIAPSIRVLDFDESRHGILSYDQLASSQRYRFFPGRGLEKNFSHLPVTKKIWHAGYVLQAFEIEKRVDSNVDSACNAAAILDPGRRCSILKRRSPKVDYPSIASDVDDLRADLVLSAA